MPGNSAQSRPDWWPTNPYHPVTSKQWNTDRYSAWEEASQAIYAAWISHIDTALEKQITDLRSLLSREGGAA